MEVRNPKNWPIKLGFCINCKHEIGLFKDHYGNIFWAHISKKLDIVSQKCLFTKCKCEKPESSRHGETG